MLGSILVLIGILLIIGAAALQFVIPNVIPGKKPLGVPKFIGAIILGFFVMFMNGVWFYSEPGMSYLVQYPWGTQTSVLSPGYHTKFWGNTIPFKKVLTVRFVDENKLKEKGEAATGIEAPIPIRFNDAVTANVAEAIRFRMPVNKEQFKKMAVDFRSMDNLVASCLKPTCKEATRNAGRMLSAQEYIAGKGGEFEQAVQDQIEGGTFILETIEDRDTSDTQIAEVENRMIERKETVKYIVRVKRDNNGSRLRKKNPFEQYGITVSQTAIEYVDPENKFKEMLGKQRDAAAEANVERQKAKKAEFEKQRIIAEGEKNKAAKRAEMEQQQVEILITAETGKKQMAILKDKAKTELEKSRLEAQSKKVLADAEAYERRAVMSADNALSARLKTLEHMTEITANAISKWSTGVPNTVIINGDGKSAGRYSSADQLLNLITAQYAAQLGLKPGTLESR